MSEKIQEVQEAAEQAVSIVRGSGFKLLSAAVFCGLIIIGAFQFTPDISTPAALVKSMLQALNLGADYIAGAALSLIPLEIDPNTVPLVGLFVKSAAFFLLMASWARDLFTAKVLDAIAYLLGLAVAAIILAGMLSMIASAVKTAVPG